MAADVVVYDKAKWHYEHRTYPQDRDSTGGFLYGGFFLAWAYLAGLTNDDLAEDFPEELRALSQRDISPVKLYQLVDGVLASDMLSDEGNAFARHCFESDTFDYYELFEEALMGDLPSPYHISDSWASFGVLKDRLDAEYGKWRSATPSSE